MLHLIAVTLVAAIVLGGSSREGLPSDLLLQLAAIPLLVAALSGYLAAPREQRSRWPLAAVLALVAVPVLQLVPLPAPVWQMLPMRGLVTEAHALAETAPAAFPLSLTPRSTWLAALSLLVPIGIFLGVTLLDYEQRRQLVAVLVVVGMTGVALGLLQVAQGRNSELRFHEITNSDSAVGFFANRNHFATLINILTVFVGAWVVAMIASREELSVRHRKKDSSWILYVVAGLLAFITLLVAQATSYSRAGLGLMLPALAFVLSFPLARLRTGDRSWSMPVRIVVGAMMFAVLLALPFAIDGIANRFTQDPLADLRVRFSRNTIEAARAVMPWGAGVGSFVPVYQIFEHTKDMVPNLYANRAHNDFLELWLETGVAGVVMAALASIWLLATAYRLWFRPAGSPLLLDHFLARAALVAIVLLLLHSAVDYPLRTGALMAVAGLCCGMLVPPMRPELPEISDPENVATAPPVRRSASWPKQPVTVQPSPGEQPSQAIPSWPEVAPADRYGRNGAAGTPPRPGSDRRDIWDDAAPSPARPWPASPHSEPPASEPISSKPRPAPPSPQWPEAWDDEREKIN